MPPDQAPQQTQGQASGTSSAGGALDPEAVALAKAIRQHESGGNPEQVGKSGEYAAYQWMPGTWKSMAKAAGVNVPLHQATLEQQNQVAYHQIKTWKDQGYNVGQIASMWNAGAGEPNAYLGTYSNGQTASGTNSYGAQYNVPAYANAVDKLYQQYKKQEMAANPPAQGSNHQQKVTTQGLSQPTDPTGNSTILGDLVNWAFPIAGDLYHDASGTSKKSALQQLGDLGLSGLWFLPGVGDVAEAGIRGAGLLGEAGAKIAGQALGGAATGYAADVSSHLAQGQTNAGQVLTPGLGTLAGGVLGGAIGKLGSKYGQEGVLNRVSNSNHSILDSLMKTGRMQERAYAKSGVSTGEFAANKGINLAGLVDNASKRYNTIGTSRTIEDQANTLHSLVGEVAKNVPGNLDTAKLGKLIADRVGRASGGKFMQAADRKAIVNDFFNKALSSDYGKQLDLSSLLNLKQEATILGKYNSTDPFVNTAAAVEKRNVYRMIGHYLRRASETMAKKGGLDGLGKMNQLIGMHYDLADALAQLDGHAARGGRLGDALSGQAGEFAGSIIGDKVGGLSGTILGFLAGHLAGKGAAAIMRRMGSYPITQRLLNHIAETDPQIVDKFVSELKKNTAKGAEAASEAKKLMNMASAGQQLSPIKHPQVGRKGGLLAGLITKAGARAGAGG